MLFDTIKLYVSNREAAERYGIEVNHYGKANCPFCSDNGRHLYVSDEGYCCFHCGEHGDVIDFTAKLFGLSLRDAAMKLARDFRLNTPPPAGAIRREVIKVA